MFYKGWIAADKDEGDFLKNLGVTIGKYNEKEHQFDNCFVLYEALEKLDPYWGRFYWGLEPIDEVVEHFNTMQEEFFM